MKKASLFLLFWALFSTQLFALTPFSLEKLEAVNVTLLNKNKFFTEELKKELKAEIEQKLQTAGIKTSANSFSNFLIKVKELKSGNTMVYHITLSLVENVQVPRQTAVDALAITYTKDDLFESSSPEADIRESISFLVEEFLDQYKEENPR